jgi:HK97 family phage major capsid protein/HK97 family phage prohead protease
MHDDRRIYSLLTFKSFDDEQRIITGIATNAETDRAGDIVDPTGAEFQLPIPLLWQHDSKQPIGEVFAAKHTKAGIEIQARISRFAEPGRLKDRLDEAWHTIKAGLVRGLSIGFRGLKVDLIEDKDGMISGFKFVKWLWIELSAVTIPANTAAAILTMKALRDFDTDLAALGTEAPVAPSIPSGVSDTVRGVKLLPRQGRPMKKTYGEQIKDLESTRAAKAARLDEIQTKALDDGRTKDDAEKTEFDELRAEITRIDAELVDLKELEKINVTKALPVAGATPDAAAAARSGTGIITVRDNTKPGIGFARAVMCKMQAFKQYRNAAEIATERYPHDARVQQYLKAAVAASNTSDATYMGALVDPANLATEFIEWLRPKTIIGNIPGLTMVPFNVRVIGQTSGGAGYWVGQGAAKPLTRFGVAPTTLTWAKVAAISVLTEELARFSSPSAEQMVRDQLAAALIERIDIDFIDPAKAAVAGVSPASITNGVAGIPATTDPLADLGALVDAFLASNQSIETAVWIMPSTVAMRLSLIKNGTTGVREFPDVTMMGGTLLGIPVVTSQYAATVGTADSAIVILANAKEIFLSDDGQVTVDVSREASLQMDDAPTMASSPAATPTTVVSMFQTNSIALRAERFINWARMRPQAVAWLDAVGYTSAPLSAGPNTTPERPRRPVTERPAA